MQTNGKVGRLMPLCRVLGEVLTCLGEVAIEVLGVEVQYNEGKGFWWISEETSEEIMLEEKGEGQG